MSNYEDLLKEVSRWIVMSSEAALDEYSRATEEERIEMDGRAMVRCLEAGLITEVEPAIPGIAEMEAVGQIVNLKGLNKKQEHALYITTVHWQTVRLAALERAGHRCQVCNSAIRLVVHHRTYERVWFEEPGDLTVLCQICHDLFHKHGRLAEWGKRSND